MIRIVADTTCVLPRSLCQQLGITIIPQMIIFGTESYRDDTELDSDTFLEKLRASTELPKTAAPPPAFYSPIFQTCMDHGDSAVVICPSSEVSGTYRSAKLAARIFPDVDIRIIDTRLMAGGLGSLVLMAQKWASEGMNIDSLVKHIFETSRRERMYFVVHTLEYLYKGGRIGKASSLLGGILQLKPILTMEDGVASPFENQRTKKRAIERVIELANQECPRSPDAHLCVVHSDALQEAQALANQLSADLGIAKIPIYQQCASIITHIGPGALSISYYRDRNGEK